MLFKNILTGVALLSILQIFIISCSPKQESNTSSAAGEKNLNGRFDTWGYVGAGGGGAMFTPAISPHDPDLAFVSCDMTGSFTTTNGGDSWRMFNLHGVTHYYVFDPLQPEVVYANSIALFRSTDSGATWNVVYPNVSEIHGVISKGDHAEEVLVTKDSTNRRVLAFGIDPSNSRKLYAAIKIDQETAFYTSDNYGESWTKEKILEDGAKKVFIIPSSPENNRTVYVAGKNTITVKENGQWKVNKCPENVKELTEVSGGFDKSNNKFIIYAMSGKSYFNPDGDLSGIFYSDNGGATWENRQEGFVSNRLKGADMPEFRTIATSANHPEVVYISYAGLQVSKDTTCFGVAKSTNYGKTWTLSWKDRIAKDKQVPASNVKDGWLNERFGPSWGENPFSLALGPNDPDLCYGTDFGRTIKTSDGGKTWEQVYTKKTGSGWTSRGLEVTTGYNIVFDPFDKDHYFINTTDIGLMESVDRGKSWRSATNNNGVPRRWANSTYWLVFDPNVKDRIYATMSGTHDLPRPKMWRKKGIAGFTGGVVISEDGSKTWKPVSGDIGESAITHVLIDPESNVDSRTLYVCAFGKGVFKSIDGGKTWSKKNNGIEGAEPFAWRIERREQDGTLFLVVARRNDDGSIGTDGDGAIYKSTDGAETWIRISLPTGTNGPMSIIEDPKDLKTLLLSAWGRNVPGKRFTPDIGGGIFRSTDDGKTWTQVVKHDQHIHDITYDNRNGVFYACGFNSSAYRSDDRGVTWQRIKGYNFKWGKRVEPDPDDPDKIFIITFGGGVWYGPAHGDEKAIEDVRTAVLDFH